MRTQSPWGIEITVAMDAAEAEKLRLREPGNRAKDSLLRAGLQSGLEAHEIPHLRRAVFLTQLHHRIWLASGLRIDEADRLHRPKAQRLDPALRHLLDGQAAFEVRDLVEFVAAPRPREVLLARDQRGDERFGLARLPAALQGVALWQRRRRRSARSHRRR